MRITGSKDNLAVIADAERGRGRPQKAIDMFADANRNDLSKDIWLELAIVAAGAHSDLGDLETARKTIEDVGFTGHKPASAIRLLQAYADPVSYTHLTLPTNSVWCRSRWSPYH